MDYEKKLNSLKKFTKQERSSFSYWYNHWKAFNLVAMQHKVWKFKYLFHDIEKPWLMLHWKDYHKVQLWHRTHNNHHLEYYWVGKVDWEAMVIDWECSRYTKLASPETAREQYNNHCDSIYYNALQENMLPILDKLKI